MLHFGFGAGLTWPDDSQELCISASPAFFAQISDPCALFPWKKGPERFSLSHEHPVAVAILTDKQLVVRALQSLKVSFAAMIASTLPPKAKRLRAGKSKSRNGCSTCKWVVHFVWRMIYLRRQDWQKARIRRVKCDEGKRKYIYLRLYHLTRSTRACSARHAS